jgi:hypothetical protein
MVIASYSPSRRGLMLYLAIIGPVGGVLVGLIPLLVLGGVKGALEFVAFFALGAFWTYLFGFRQVYLLELTPAELRMRSLLRRRAVPLGDVRSIRCAKSPRRDSTADFVTVEFAHRGPLKFAGTTPGLKEFLDQIHQAAPQATVEAPVS